MKKKNPRLLGQGKKTARLLRSATKLVKDRGDRREKEKKKVVAKAGEKKSWFNGQEKESRLGGRVK